MKNCSIFHIDTGWGLLVEYKCKVNRKDVLLFDQA